MRLIYQGTDISDYVDMHSCVHRDVSGGRCDSIDIEFEHAGNWYAWQPARDDVIEVEHDGYTTGRLYLNTILPENGRYRLIATSLPGSAMRRTWQSFRDMTLADIMRSCAAQCDMDWALYGLDEGTVYPYIERQNESCAAFLNRLMRLEGAVLKCVNGRMAGIGIGYAQEIEAMQEITISAEQDAAQYRRLDGMKYGALTIRTPFAEATARDSAASGEQQILTCYPARDIMQAGRWARGLLLENNRRAEQLTLTTELNIGMTAMARIDISGSTDASGDWLVDEAEHDFINERTTARLLRCISTIQ
ncbi:MAG: phage late control D family protein [Clostridia bacterium]|nr:phage late control D family protein [Clostridia bacterium]